MPSAHGGQKRVSNSLNLESQIYVTWCGMWVLGIKPGSSQEQQGLLTAQPSLHPLTFFFFFFATEVSSWRGVLRWHRSFLLWVHGNSLPPSDSCYFCWEVHCRRAWWRMPLIPALGRQRQVDFWVRGQPGLQSEFQDSQGYTEKPCLKKQTNKQEKSTVI
jgi:hypothetical protein